MADEISGCQYKLTFPVKAKGCSSKFAYSGCRAIQELHQYAADEIGVDSATRAEMERLLNNLQQLLVGISIMQVSNMATTLRAMLQAPLLRFSGEIKVTDLTSQRAVHAAGRPTAHNW